jgi:hypothetical protein
VSVAARRAAILQGDVGAQEARDDDIHRERHDDGGEHERPQNRVPRLGHRASSSIPIETRGKIASHVMKARTCTDGGATAGADAGTAIGAPGSGVGSTMRCEAVVVSVMVGILS